MKILLQEFIADVKQVLLHAKESIDTVRASFHSETDQTPALKSLGLTPTVTPLMKKGEHDVLDQTMTPTPIATTSSSSRRNSFLQAQQNQNYPRNPHEEFLATFALEVITYEIKESIEKAETAIQEYEKTENVFDYSDTALYSTVKVELQHTVRKLAQERDTNAVLLHKYELKCAVVDEIRETLWKELCTLRFDLESYQDGTHYNALHGRYFDDVTGGDGDSAGQDGKTSNGSSPDQHNSPPTPSSRTSRVSNLEKRLKDAERKHALEMKDITSRLDMEKKRLLALMDSKLETRKVEYERTIATLQADAVVKDATIKELSSNLATLRFERENTEQRNKALLSRMKEQTEALEAVTAEAQDLKRTLLTVPQNAAHDLDAATKELNRLSSIEKSLEYQVDVTQRKLDEQAADLLKLRSELSNLKSTHLVTSNELMESQMIVRKLKGQLMVLSAGTGQQPPQAEFTTSVSAHAVLQHKIIPSDPSTIVNHPLLRNVPVEHVSAVKCVVGECLGVIYAEKEFPVEVGVQTVAATTTPTMTPHTKMQHSTSFTTAGGGGGGGGEAGSPMLKSQNIGNTLASEVMVMNRIKALARRNKKTAGFQEGQDDGPSSPRGMGDRMTTFRRKQSGVSAFTRKQSNVGPKPPPSQPPTDLLPKASMAVKKKGFAESTNFASMRMKNRSQILQAPMSEQEGASSAVVVSNRKPKEKKDVANKVSSNKDTTTTLLKDTSKSSFESKLEQQDVEEPVVHPRPGGSRNSNSSSQESAMHRDSSIQHSEQSRQSIQSEQSFASQGSLQFPMGGDGVATTLIPLIPPGEINAVILRNLRTDSIQTVSTTDMGSPRRLSSQHQFPSEVAWSPRTPAPFLSFSTPASPKGLQRLNTYEKTLEKMDATAAPIEAQMSQDSFLLPEGATGGPVVVGLETTQQQPPASPQLRPKPSFTVVKTSSQSVLSREASFTHSSKSPTKTVRIDTGVDVVEPGAHRKSVVIVAPEPGGSSPTALTPAPPPQSESSSTATKGGSRPSLGGSTSRHHFVQLVASNIFASHGDMLSQTTYDNNEESTSANTATTTGESVPTSHQLTVSGSVNLFRQMTAMPGADVRTPPLSSAVVEALESPTSSYDDGPKQQQQQPAGSEMKSSNLLSPKMSVLRLDDPQCPSSPTRTRRSPNKLDIAELVLVGKQSVVGLRDSPYVLNRQTADSSSSPKYLRNNITQFSPLAPPPMLTVASSQTDPIDCHDVSVAQTPVDLGEVDIGVGLDLPICQPILTWVSNKRSTPTIPRRHKIPAKALCLVPTTYFTEIPKHDPVTGLQALPPQPKLKRPTNVQPPTVHKGPQPLRWRVLPDEDPSFNF
eukprot:PhF_6_TR22581/c0_g1_i3/m.32185